MIGNDIIDLNLAKTQSNWKRKGFLEKQFTVSEINHILNSEKPFITVWRFWSMKESAYKCYTQKLQKRFFAPKKFECFLISNEKGIVIFNNQKFYSKTIINSLYIHTIVNDILEENNNNGNLFKFIGSSKTVDKDLKNQLQKEIGVNSLHIVKRKSDIGVPFFYHQEKKITESCTISHHGNHGAFSYTLVK